MRLVKHGRSILKVSTAAALLLLSASSFAQGIEVEFRWSPSPTVGDEGEFLAPAVEYEVYHQRDGGNPYLVTTVPDTTVALDMEPGIRHRVRVCGIDEDGRSGEPSEWSKEVYFAIPQVGEVVPPAPGLKPNFPNPFNPETNIVYGVPENIDSGKPITLEAYTLRGQLVRRLMPETSPGWHSTRWDGKDDRGRTMPTGTYVTMFRCNGQAQTGKMTMVK